MAEVARSSLPAGRERPILFSAPMVLAILEDRKTQTRRIVRPEHAKLEPKERLTKCPYGRPGDRLWVRETFATLLISRKEAVVAYRASCPKDTFDYVGADGSISRIRVEQWRPSIFMVRALSRISLEVTDVRTERLHELTEVDALAEGIKPITGPTYFAPGQPTVYEIEGQQFETARRAFAFAWDGINGSRADWEKDPLVWVVSFRRLPEEA